MRPRLPREQRARRRGGGRGRRGGGSRRGDRTSAIWRTGRAGNLSCPILDPPASVRVRKRVHRGGTAIRSRRRSRPIIRLPAALLRLLSLLLPPWSRARSPLLHHPPAPSPSPRLPPLLLPPLRLRRALRVPSLPRRRPLRPCLALPLKTLRATLSFGYLELDSCGQKDGSDDDSS